MKYMLDTNICIYVLNTRSKALRHKFNVNKDLCISSITWAELCFGVDNSPPSLKSQRWSQLKRFARRLLIVPFGDSAGIHYGQVRSQLKREGQLIGPNDLLIAAHALAEGSTLISNNLRELKRVPGLKIENWI